MHKKKLINRYWLILVAELVIMFLVSVLDKHHFIVALNSLAIFLMVVITIEICFELNFLRIASVVFGSSALVFGITWLLTSTSSYAYETLLISSSSFAVFFAIAIIAIGKHVFLSAKATINMIVGSVSIYLLIGLCFAFIYTAMTLALGGRFYLDGAPMQVGVKLGTAGFKEFIYFSFSTLTTTGYGDMVPKDSITRMTSYIEGILGSLYLAVVVAKLVGMYVTQGMKNPEQGH